MKLAHLAFAATLVLTSATVFAQTAPASVSPAATTPVPRATINQRKENQQDRIAQGVKNGTLSPSETARLEHQEAGINKEERGMRAQDNGKLTKQDRKTLRQQQNQESKRIYNTKHDLHGHK